MQSRYGYGGDSTRRAWTRWLAPVAAILVAAGAQLYVILYPRPVDVAPVSPAKAARKQQELVIEGLDIGNFKLVHSGYKNELVEVEFKNAHLAEDTLAELKSLPSKSGVAFPIGPQRIFYYSPPAPSETAGAPAQPAKTSIESGVAPAGARSPELHLFQDPEGHDEVPDIRMHVQDGSLVVTLHTDPPPEAAAPESRAATKRAVGANKHLSIGEPDQGLWDRG